MDVDKLLAAFSNWRITALESGAMVVDHTVAHLLSGLDFDGGTKGYAGVGVACSKTQGTGIDETNYASEFSNGLVLAHEIGHNLGMVSGY